MKQFLMGIAMAAGIFTLSACTTVGKLQSAPSCQVWEEQGMFPPRSVQPAESSAQYKGQCSLMGMFMCSWVRADFNPQSKRIAMEGSGLFESKREAATLENDAVVFEPSILDKVGKSSPAKVDRSSKTVTRTMTITALGLDQSSEETVHFNDHCTSEQAALGALALWSGRSRDR